MRVRELVDQLSAMLAYWDGTERCRFANRAYRDWFRIEREVVGLPMSEVLGPVYPSSRPFIDAVLRGHPQEFEQCIPDPGGGRPRYSLTHYVPDIHDGQVQGFFAMLADISSLKRAQTDLLELERKLQANERMMALGTLAAGIAHEINNPLTSVTLNIQLALEELELDAFDRLLVKADLREAKAGAERIASLVGRMRLLGRGALADEVVDLKQALDESIAIASASLPAHARLVRDYRDPGCVKADAAQLKQVFVSLLTNAAEALRERPEAVLQVRTSRGEASVLIEFVDNGGGIPQGLQSRVFTPFFTTRPPGAGVGLSLSIAAAIIKGLGGDLTFTSREEQGSVFSIRLPRVD